MIKKEFDEFPFPQIAAFLRQIAPFDTLHTDELMRTVLRMEIAYAPRGEIIMKQGGAAADFLFIIHVGSVRITMSGDAGEEILADTRGEGDHFGDASILQGTQSFAEIVALEDTILYLIPAEAFKRLVDTYPAFERTFRFPLAKYIKGACESTNRLLSQPDASRTINLESFLIGKSVSDLMVKNILTCSPDTSIRNAAGKMTEKQASSIVILNDTGMPLGILTNRDLRSKVVAEGRCVEDRVTDVMSRDLYTVDSKTNAIDALLYMSRHDVRHLLITEEKSLVGVVSEHDFQMEIGSSPLGIMGQIEKADMVSQLSHMRPKIENVLEMLFIQGISIDKIVSLISEINDRVTSKILHLTEAEMKDSGMGCVPVSYCWMALGSEGRREQTTLTDQDNALAFVDVQQEDEERVRNWFHAFSGRVVDNLVQYGIPRCPGGMMASNPSWCLSEKKWQATFLDWIAHPEPLVVALSMIFFDFRAVQAGAEFVEHLRKEILEAIQRNYWSFIVHAAQEALQNSPPIGFFREFIVERSGEHQHQLDLKRRGMRPIVEASRIKALSLGIHATNTLERLAGIHESGDLEEGLYSDIHEAYNLINRLRIGQYLDAKALQQEPDNFIDPRRLNSLQRSMLKECFMAIDRFQKKLLLPYMR